MTQAYNGIVPGVGANVSSNVSIPTSQGDLSHKITEVVLSVYMDCPPTYAYIGLHSNAGGVSRDASYYLSVPDCSSIGTPTALVTFKDSAPKYSTSFINSCNAPAQFKPSSNSFKDFNILHPNYTWTLQFFCTS